MKLNFQRKVGVMYCRAGQSSEEDMYNNESSGPAFEEFLDLLGERVRLKGWEKYRAQLDNKSKLKTRTAPESTGLDLTLSGDHYLKRISAPLKALDNCYLATCNRSNACKIASSLLIIKEQFSLQRAAKGTDSTLTVTV